MINMPKGPQGQKRPADAISRAVMVARIATGEIEDTTSRIGRSAGGKVRAMVLSPKQRKEIASAAAKARWQNVDELELDMSELSILKRELFGDSSSSISDIKFYPGESTECSPDDIAGAIRSAISDVEQGNGEKIDLSF